jgi:hypothetical protein
MDVHPLHMRTITSEVVSSHVFVESYVQMILKYIKMWYQYHRF